MRQLSGIDAGFLAWEGPSTFGHVTGVVLLDPTSAPDGRWTFDGFVAHLRGRLDRMPTLTTRLIEIPLGLDRPYWVPDERFDLDRHLHRAALPGGGGRDELSELVARLHERPLDRRYPLWECHVVENVRVLGGGVDGQALVAKIHHAAIDGVSGQEILAQLVDLEPDPAPPAPPEPADPDEDPTGHDDDIAAETPPISAELVRATAVSLARTPIRLAQAAMAVYRAAPVLAPGLGREGPVARGDETVGELLRRFGAAPATPFNATIGPRRSWAFASVPLDDVKAIKNTAGTTVNDAILAIVAGVLRRWLLERDELPDRPLAAMVPLSVRGPDGGPMGNQVSPTMTTLATHLEEPGARLAAIAEGMTTAKRAHEALPADILTDITQVTPPAVTALAARLVAATRLADRVTLPFNLVVSNVPGPPIPLYIAGARVAAYYPVSTIMDGMGLNVTVQSTNGMLDFGYVCDPELIDDVWSLADLTEPALQELAASVAPVGG